MTANPSTMNAALDRLWAKFLPEIGNRLSVVQKASQALRSGSLSGEEREAAHQAAHKLAGVLGTFGLHRGTELARQAELLLAEEASAGSAQELVAWLAELQSVIDGRR